MEKNIQIQMKDSAKQNKDMLWGFSFLSGLFEFPEQGLLSQMGSHDSSEVLLCLLAPTALQSHSKMLLKYSKDGEQCVCLCVSASAC